MAARQPAESPVGWRRARGHVTTRQFDAGDHDRFLAAVKSLGPGLGDFMWRANCAGEGRRDAETALVWPARAGKLVLGLALDRIASFCRMP